MMYPHSPSRLVADSLRDSVSPVKLLEACNVPDALGVVVRMMTLSLLHRRWTIGDVERLILPPIELKQCLFAEIDGTLGGFVSWALFSEEVSEVFANRARPLQEHDWDSGNQLWIIDFIGPNGAVSQITRQVKAYLCERYPEKNRALAIRYKDLGRVRRLSRWAR